MQSIEQLRSEAATQARATIHVRKGRSFDFKPHDRVAGPDPYRIARTALKVARIGKDGVSGGRWEAWSNSRELLHRMEEIGSRPTLCVQGLKIGPVMARFQESLALELYLKSAKGLKYFRRINGTRGFTRAALIDLLSRIGIPTNHVTPGIQPTDQIPAGPENKGRLGEDRRSLQDRP